MAYVVDYSILGVVGAGVGQVYFDKLSRLGYWGLLAGFCVALVYFAYFDSKLGDGQTPGKRWLGLRVIDARGDTIPFAGSLVRSVIFLVPAFLFGVNLPETQAPWVTPLMSAVFLWIGGSTLYLIIFNRSTRQGLHDLAVGSYVARGDDTGPVEAKAIERTLWITLAAFLVIGSAGAYVVNAKVETMPPIPEMRHDARLIEQVNGVQRARVSDLLGRSSAGGGVTKDILVSIHLKSKPPSQEALADEVARVVLQNDQNAEGYERIRILLFDGYDVGIATHWDRQEFAHSPAEWRQRVFGTSPAQSPPPAHQ